MNSTSEARNLISIDIENIRSFLNVCCISESFRFSKWSYSFDGSSFCLSIHNLNTKDFLNFLFSIYEVRSQNIIKKFHLSRISRSHSDGDVIYFLQFSYTRCNNEQ